MFCRFSNALAHYISFCAIMIDNAENEREPLEYPVDGTLDLHQFLPSQTRDVLLEYIAACRERKIFAVRVVHGKGIGVQREIVRSVLENHPHVIAFRHESGAGGWGATIVDLERPA